MAQRGRKSAASKQFAAVVAATDRLAPPPGLLPSEVIVWNETVSTWPADDLRGLADFCKHTALARRLGDEIEALGVMGEAKERRRLARDRARELKAATAIERSARATRRARRDAPKVAAVYAVRPWQGWGNAEADKYGPPLPAGWYDKGGPGYRWRGLLDSQR